GCQRSRQAQWSQVGAMAGRNQGRRLSGQSRYRRDPPVRGSRRCPRALGDRLTVQSLLPCPPTCKWQSPRTSLVGLLPPPPEQRSDELARPLKGSPPSECRPKQERLRA